MAQTQAKFLPGKVYATPEFMANVGKSYALAALRQHLQGEWGLICKEDWKANDDALISGARIMSVYALPHKADNFWIITEAEDDNGERSATTFLLPSEY